MFLSMYILKSLISIGIFATLFLGITFIYVLLYAFIISSMSAQVLPDIRNGFIIGFIVIAIMMIVSSLVGIYGMMEKIKKFVLAYSIAMAFYFVVVGVLLVLLIELPTLLVYECSNPSQISKSINNTVYLANKILGK